MHVNIISGSESCVEWLEVTSNQNEHDFSRHGEEHEGITEPLSEQRELSGLTDQCIEQLANNDTIEVGTLGIFHPLGGIAGGLVGKWRYLLDIARAIIDYRRINSITIDNIAIKRCHSEINLCMFGVDPIDHDLAVIATSCT